MVLPLLATATWVGPPLTEKLKWNGALPLAPVNVIKGEGAFRQTVEVPEIVAVGNGFTSTVRVATLFTVWHPARVLTLKVTV